MLDFIYTLGFFLLMLVIFKLMPRFKVDNLSALSYNYITALICCIFLLNGKLPEFANFGEKWFYFAMAVGFLFIIVFFWFVKASQTVGLAISTIANKISLIFPVFVGVALYPTESVSGYKVIGIVAAILGIVLSGIGGTGVGLNKKNIWLILGIFVGQGFADVLFADLAKASPSSVDNKMIFTIIFSAALLTGLLIALFTKKIKELISIKSMFWGVMIGLPNFGTLYFMFRAVGSSGLQIGQLYPLLSLFAIIFSAILGWLIFKEKLSKSQILGVIISTFGIFSILYERLW